MFVSVFLHSILHISRVCFSFLLLIYTRTSNVYPLYDFPSLVYVSPVLAVRLYLEYTKHYLYSSRLQTFTLLLRTN